MPHLLRFLRLDARGRLERDGALGDSQTAKRAFTLTYTYTPDRSLTNLSPCLPSLPGSAARVSTGLRTCFATAPRLKPHSSRRVRGYKLIPLASNF